MALDPTKLAKLIKLSALQTLAQKVKGEIEAVGADTALAIKKVTVSGNTISFFRSTEEGATAAFTVDFPNEMFLDQAMTQFVGNFTWSAATYPDSTNPNLDGKPVFVLGVKTQTAAGTQTIAYSFLDMETLVDTYAPASGETAITVNGYTLTINVSAQANNALEKKADGLFVDISGKTDKVSGATSGNIAGLGADGNLTDSGIAANDILLASANISPDADVQEMIDTVWPST